jgi:hypothetical protein
MAEVYAVPGSPAPSPAGAYPVWHQYVGAISIVHFDMQPHGRRALLGASLAIENGRNEDGGRQSAVLPLRP